MADSHSTVPLKRCTSCGNEKPATSEFFHAYKRAPGGLRSVCRMCRAAAYAANREAERQKRRDYYAANSERLKELARAAYWDDPERNRAAAMVRHYRERDTRLRQMRAYRADNLQVLLEKQRARFKERFRRLYGVDPEFTLRHRMRALLRATVKRGRDGRRTVDLLGYTLQELRVHLERQFTKGMSWEKVLSGEIEIDHIRPIASFTITSYDDPAFRECWGLPNLRPMWASDNRSKGAKVLTLV